jgi:flagellin
MVSINNTAGNSAVLASLRQINADIATNQTRIGTGLKINKYSDNPALYATAQSIRADIKSQDTLSANIGIVKARADAASAGLDKISEILTKMGELASSVAGSAAGSSEVLAAKSKFTAYQTQMEAIASSSGFQGKSFLKNTTAGYTDTVKLSNETDADIAFTGEIDASAGANMALLDTAISGATTGDAISGLSDEITAALGEIVALQASVSSFSEMLGSQLDFQTTLKGINESALSSIVDANLEEESAKSTALQVKQQLAYQALSIGNSSAQNVLRLFQ